MSVAHDPGQMQNVWERNQVKSAFLPALWSSAAQVIRREYRPSLRCDHHAGDRNGDLSGVDEGCWPLEIGRLSKPRRRRATNRSTVRTILSAPTSRMPKHTAGAGLYVEPVSEGGHLPGPHAPAGYIAGFAAV